MSSLFTRCRSTAVPLPQDHIDTDQIIPARFLKVTTKEGVADGLFADWRRDPAFVLNRPEHRNAQFLLSGENFGCGSSREHAPWALVAWGFRAVIARSFADIFRSNALKNGLLPVAVPADAHAELLEHVTAEPCLEIEIDLITNRLTASGRRPVEFEIDSFGRLCLLEGIDQLQYILRFESAIARYEASHG